MFIETAYSKYFIKRQGATFLNRLGCYDCIIYKQHEKHGVVLEDGNRYIVISRFDAKSGELLTKSQSLPKEITLEKLRKWGFIDKITPNKWLLLMKNFMRGEICFFQ